MSPRDLSISARNEYRTIIKREYDLVLVENGYPLEPNYVLIDGLSSTVNASEIGRFNLQHIKLNQEDNDVIVKKFLPRDNDNSKFCVIVFDFGANSRNANIFAE